jgi:hypothetical protein
MSDSMAFPNGKLLSPCQKACPKEGGNVMGAIPRITVEEARQKILTGESLFVCAYDGDTRFNQLRLDGAVSLKEFQSHLAELPRYKEIIFYCA